MKTIQIIGVIFLSITGILKADVLISTNFDDIGAANTSVASGTVLSGFTAQTTPANDLNLAVVDKGSGDYVLRFRDNYSSAVNNTPLIYETFSSLATGNLAGSFIVTPLLSSSGTDFRCFLNSSGTVSDSSHTIMSITINGSNTVKYQNGSTSTASSLVLSSGTSYVFSYTVDLTNNTWRLQVATTASPSTYLLDTGSISTRADVAAGSLVFDAGANPSGVNASDFMELSNVYLASIPETKSASLIGVGILGLAGVWWMRTRKLVF